MLVIMKVLQINALYGHGSTGTIVRDIEYLCELSGNECYVASPDPKVRKAKRSYLIGNGIDHKLHAIISRVHGKQAYYSHIPTHNLLQWIDKIMPDIVHLHNLHSNYINLNMLLKYLAKRDIRTVYTFHDCWLFTGGCFHYASVECKKWQTDCSHCPKKYSDTPAFLSKKSAEILADRKQYVNAIPRLTIIGASEWVANECKHSVLFSCNIGYIHNGFDLDIFKPTASDLRKRYGLEGKYVLLGSAMKWYNPLNTDTYKYFVSNMSEDMVLVLFGCSTIHRKLIKNVIEIGFIYEPKEMAALYSMADIFVNCTREDTLPGVNLECQATGTPVVTYDATGCKETISDHCGRAVKTGDYEALYEAVLEIRSIGKPALSEKCIAWIRDNFEKGNSYQQYIDLYKHIYKDKLED